MILVKSNGICNQIIYILVSGIILVVILLLAHPLAILKQITTVSTTIEIQVINY